MVNKTWDALSFIETVNSIACTVIIVVFSDVHIRHCVGNHQVLKVYQNSTTWNSKCIPSAALLVVTHTQTDKKKIMDELLQHTSSRARQRLIYNTGRWQVCDYDLYLIFNIMVFRYHSLESGCVRLFISNSQINPYRQHFFVPARKTLPCVRNKNWSSLY